MQNIVCVSGGLSSAWVALWASRQDLQNTVYYFNDTKWEHEDLYRFINECAEKIGYALTIDSDGRSPEDVFFDRSMLGNNRVPLCSRILKAERLQRFAHSGDVVYFGIDNTEAHRARRIAEIYNDLGIQARFPIIENRISKEKIHSEIAALGIRRPVLYDLGFTHNNCSGGCVRSGKRQWINLLQTLPAVYQERERVETEFSEAFGINATYMKDMSLSELRRRIEGQAEIDFNDDQTASECIGICNYEQ
jgi:hypothetical protein